ncbi:hypothetical protein INT08_04265 [Prosthecochloris sp. N3]|uniref:Polysulfide reductase n=1 Tax=Prosthecochloris ethylica TaxID=2743976 RepID=A0ABR9XR70_9CHLB|nr:hypothetical protein [Prosthecochloris ethylica]MBF0586390.1 hypothetical protein [Prosthecochloris ethylica]MBF0636392.1 hypothetical protein [Prosthecochloris ethylica]NUK47566.1 hypothetical protein [Prosthecochloris ethylica]
MRSQLGESYSPMYFLASLGSGGIAVTFFMFLMFMVEHPGRPIPVFEDVMAALLSGNPWLAGLVVLSVAGIVYFGVQHYRLLVWNIREYAGFRKTAAFASLRSTDAEVQLMALPLTYAMGVNVMFILGAVFVPGLWGVVEYLFPFAMAAFLAIGVYASSIFLLFFSRVIAKGHFDCERNNSLSQMLSIFAFSMVAVGLSASAAMSHNAVTSGLGIILASVFSAIVVTLGMIKVVLGFRSMLANGINYEASVSLWIVIPILTVMAITVNRVSMGLVHNFNAVIHPWFHIVFFSMAIAVQVLFGLLGYRVMKQMGYFSEFINGEGKSVVTYAAICPGVAFFVLGNFLVNKGLVAAGFVPQFSLVYFVLYVPLVLVQVQTIRVLGKLNAKLLRA